MLEKRNESSQERPRKRRRVSEKADSCSYPFLSKDRVFLISTAVKRRRLDDVSLQNCPHISRDEYYKAWLTNAGRPLRSHKMSQLPSPDVTTRSFSRAPTNVSVRSTASVHDTDYRERLEQYNIYVPGENPPIGLKEEVQKIVFRLRESPEPDDTYIEGLKKVIKELQNKGEEEVRSKLGAHIIPGYDSPSDERLAVVHGQLWNKSIAVPLDSSFIEPPLPLPKPKPDTTFSFSKAAFNRFQLATINSLVQAPNGPSFASPYQDLRFPFASVEYKSQAKDGSIRVATNQGVGAGAIALNGYLELMSRGPGLDTTDFNKFLFFSVTIDQNIAYVNMVWVGKTPDTNQHSFHLEELRILPLQYDNSIRVLIRALKNIQDYAANTILKRVVDALDVYRNNIIKKNADLVEKPQIGAGSHAPPSPPRPPQSKRARGAASKARKETTKLPTQSKQDTQTQAETQPVGARTRRKARVEETQRGHDRLS
ncbi:MAG: hypothetical protein Q9214_005645 [Letrouitia sp. 1 TL-2023]